MHKMSDLFGRRIYSETSNFIGTAKDILIDPAEGRIKFLLKEEAGSILKRDRDGARKFIKENFVPFESVKAVGDIIIVR